MIPRIQYFIAILITILIGILSRKITFIPLFIGDILYAVLIYFIFRFIFIQIKNQTIAVYAFLFCCGIEFLQLYQATWMISLRHTLFGKYVLGQGFLWSDLFAYFVGILLAIGIDKYIIKNKRGISASLS